MPEPDTGVRNVAASEHAAVVDLAGQALGWDPSKPNLELFTWKHVENPAGPSVMLVSERGGDMVGFRAFMRWRLQSRGAGVFEAFRAVDTATHPAHLRQGVFTRLTETALAEIGPAGVFNTPNDASLPGYLKLGWVDAGRLRVAAKPLGVGSLGRLFSARTAADKWSIETTVGDSAAVALATPEVAAAAERAIAETRPDPSGALCSAIDLAWLRWRYGFAPLHYRVFVPGSTEQGMVVFRLRRRGGAVEAVVNQLLVPSKGDQRVAERRLINALGRAVPADYLLMLGRSDLRGGCVPVAGQGPRLVVRPGRSAIVANVDNWRLGMGDIELF